ncbi:hypothetical protein SDC9_194361 [bioreactor metagenome]|uniref:Uncharacterized protein n=1 Tax=bioreactor metagenome TaxID=1076179 RepID=A0A645IHD3_9ZZZZ
MKARVDKSYPQKPVQTIAYRYSVPDDLIEVKRLLSDKIWEIRKFQNRPDDEIPACSKEDRWERDEKWAIMKKGRKSAVKLCTTFEEANLLLDSYGTDHYIEHRPGTPTKCLDYCTVCDHCSFYREYVKGLEQEGGVA